MKFYEKATKVTFSLILLACVCNFLFDITQQYINTRWKKRKVQYRSSANCVGKSSNPSLTKYLFSLRYSQSTVQNGTGFRHSLRIFMLFTVRGGSGCSIMAIILHTQILGNKLSPVSLSASIFSLLSFYIHYLSTIFRHREIRRV